MERDEKSARQVVHIPVGMHMSISIMVLKPIMVPSPFSLIAVIIAQSCGIVNYPAKIFFAPPRRRCGTGPVRLPGRHRERKFFLNWSKSRFFSEFSLYKMERL